MKVTRRQVDFDTVELTIVATGKPGDNSELNANELYKPYNGVHTVDWGDGTPWQVLPQPIDDPGPPVTSKDDPTVVEHTYAGQGAWRIRVHGDASVVVHGLSSKVMA